MNVVERNVSQYSLNTAVLFLIFNRLDTTERVFEAIREAKPPRLYISADGARLHKDGEKEKVGAVRDFVLSNIDWECEVSTLFRDNNLGCKMGVSGGISWFFEHEEEGIILEDDVLPLPSFFYYCEELLNKYRDNKTIAMVSGCNLISNRFTADSSYFFSKYSHIWGWATWRRSWNTYDVSISEWPTWKEKEGLAQLSDGSVGFVSYWRDIFDKVYKGGIDTWDYQWMFSCWKKKSLTILPKNNLVYNLGFDSSDATHTTGGEPGYVTDSSPKDLDFPLMHPICVERSCVADVLIDSSVFSITWLGLIKRKLLNTFIIGNFLRKVKSVLG